MGTELATKTCGMCSMDIPKQARKCPHCQHFQNRVSMLMYHPAFGFLYATIPFVGFLVFFASAFDSGEDFQSYQSQVQVTDSELAFGDTKSGGTIAVMGIITNTSPVPWKSIQFHVDFFDAEGRRADVGQKEEYSFYLPPKAATSFKVSFRREFPATSYVKHAVRVLTAKDARTKW